MYQGSRFLQCTSLITETALSLAARTMNLGGCIPIRCHQARLLISMETPPPPPPRPGPAPAAVDKQPRPPCMYHLVNTDPASWAGHAGTLCMAKLWAGSNGQGFCVLCLPSGAGVLTRKLLCPSRDEKSHLSEPSSRTPHEAWPQRPGLRALYTHTDMHAHTRVHTHTHANTQRLCLSAGGEYACACAAERKRTWIPLLGYSFPHPAPPPQDYDLPFLCRDSPGHSVPSARMTTRIFFPAKHSCVPREWKECGCRNAGSPY